MTRGTIEALLIVTNEEKIFWDRTSGTSGSIYPNLAQIGSVV